MPFVPRCPAGHDLVVLGPLQRGVNSVTALEEAREKRETDVQGTSMITRIMGPNWETPSHHGPSHHSDLVRTPRLEVPRRWVLLVK